MAAEVISPGVLVTSLDTELQNARATLRGVEDNIKRVFGKEASELASFQRIPRTSVQLRIGTGRIVQEEPLVVNEGYIDEPRGVMLSRGRVRDVAFTRREGDGYIGRDEEPLDKRRRFDNFSVTVNRSTPVVVTSRLFKPRYEDDTEIGLRTHIDRDTRRDLARDREPQRLQSRVVSSGKEKSREEALQEQRDDQSGRARNKRMFGALLGTLHRFKQDESKLKEKEDRRAQIEAKLEEQAQQEKESVKKEKQLLIRERRSKLTEIRKLEIKKHRLEELEEWETKTRCLRNFIRTETKPHIFYLPKQMNPIAECRLEETKQIVEEMIVSKRKLVMSELESLEFETTTTKRYWERPSINGKEPHEKPIVQDKEVAVGRRRIDSLDDNLEDELNALMDDEELDEEQGQDNLGNQPVRRRISTGRFGEEVMKDLPHHNHHRLAKSAAMRHDNEIEDDVYEGTEDTTQEVENEPINTSAEGEDGIY